MRVRCNECGETYNHFDDHKCKPKTKLKTAKSKLARTDEAPDATSTASARNANDESSKGADSGSSICLTCNRPLPMSNAQRQRAYRQRQKAKT